MAKPVVSKLPARDLTDRNDRSEQWKLGTKGVETVHISFSFTNKKEVPFYLEKRDWNPVQYAVKRTEETFQGKANYEGMTSQRKEGNGRMDSVMDSGRKIGELENCQGGGDLVRNLLSRGWEITGAWWEIRESEESRARNKNSVKYRVHLLFGRKGSSPKAVGEVAMKGLWRLLFTTWKYCHMWDNRKVNGGITVNFTVIRFQEKPKMVIRMA